MPEPPRDSLAEHPLGTAPPKSRPRPGSLDLFPDIGETPLSPTTPSAPAAEPEPDAPSTGRAAAREEPSPEIDEPGDPIDAPEDAANVGVAFARRVAAGLADLLILALVGAVELAAGALLLELRFPPAALMPLGAFLFLAALVLLVLAPFVWGTTPGMALADLRIRAEDGGSPTLASSFLRFTGFLLTGALAGVPLLVAAFDRRGRTLSDLLSRTTVAGAERAG
jgi:uncharacterized RDD family membrane protein YckC